MRLNFKFDLQLFGGGGGTTVNQQSYTPSEYELQLQKAQADYADAVAPNSLWLNDTARNLLAGSLGTVQVDFNGLNQQAQNQIYSANSGLSALTGSNTGAANTANDTLGNISNLYGAAANGSNSVLSDFSSRYSSAGDKANTALADLQHGILPGSYLQNMSDAISTSIKNTLGKSLNSLANRGVINSSVTNQAIDDIEKNTSDALARNYLNNISTIQGLVKDQYGTTADVLGNQTNIANTQLTNTNNALNSQADIANKQFSNILNANSANADIYNSLVNNATSGITTAAAAQEAAQAPALNLWNASLGLNGAGTSALAAAAGKGTSTSTTKTSGGGGLLSGLMGGLL